MTRWNRFAARVRRFGHAITPAVENLSLESLKHFKQEPALWIGAAVAVFTAAKDAQQAGADEWTVAAVVVIALAGFVTRANVSPVKVADSE